MTRIVVVTCPECSGNVSVYEDEIGESGNCPNCGAVVKVQEDAVAAGDESDVAEGQLDALGLADDLDSDLLFEDEEPPADDAEAVPEVEASVEAGVTELAEEPTGKSADAPEEEDSELVEEPPSELVEALDGREPVNGPADYAVWQGVVQAAGDWAMAARLHALRQAQERGCLESADPTDPGDVLARMVVAEAAVGSFQSQGEREWRRDWTGRLLQIARKWPDDDAAREGVVAALARTDAVIEELKAAGIWPWS